MNNNQPLVSVITPCFNGEKFLKNYLDSLLHQQYKNYEFFIVNDGSTDNSEEIILSYRNLFERNGNKFFYYKTKNSGQAAAINIALKDIRGKYLIWLDCDDIIYPENIEQKVNFLESHNEFAFVMCQARCINEYGEKLYLIGDRWDKQRNFFEDLIFEHNVFFAPCMYMVKTDALFSVMHDKQIKESPVGQNWQLLLPMSFSYKCGYIDKVLCDYLVHSESHSHSQNTYFKALTHYNNQKALLQYLVNDILKDVVYKKTLSAKIEEKYMHRRLVCAWKFFKNNDFQREFYLLKHLKKLTRKEIILWIINKTIILKLLYFLLKLL